MSWNLVISDFNDSGPKMMLTRAKAGITSTATINKDDWITFEDTDIRALVVEISHRWERPGGLIAPNSVARCVIQDNLTEEQWDKLRAIGFKDIPA